MKLGYEKTKTLVLHYSSKGKSKNSRLGCKICIFSSRRERDEYLWRQIHLLSFVVTDKKVISLTQNWKKES